MLSMIPFLLAGPALAQEAPIEAPPPELAALEAVLAEARAQGEAAAARAAALEAFLAEVSTLIDDRRAEEERVAAAQALGRRADPASLPFLDNALRTGPVAVQVAALDALGAMPGPEALAMGVEALDAREEAVVRAAIALLGVLPDDAAGEALYGWAATPDRPEELVDAARAALAEGHPELFALRGPIQAVEARDLGDALVGVAANGVAGGVIFSSIGVWGQSDAGPALGAVGGAAVGLGTGAIYSLARPVSFSNSLQYASGVGWGLELGLLSTFALHGDERPSSFDDVTALLMTAGVASGAGLALWRFKADPEPIDVVELNLSALLGQQIGFGVAHVALDPGYGYEAAWDLDTRPRMVAALAGTAAGAAAGWLARDRWDLSTPEAVFAGTVGAELLWLGSWLPIAVQQRGVMGSPRLAASAGLAGALVFAERFDPGYARTAAMAYGFATATAVGAGVPLFFEGDDVRGVVAPMLVAGVAGGAGGYLLGERLEMTRGRFTMMGVGLPLLGAEMGTLAAVMAANGVLEDQEIPAFVLTGTGLGAMGLLGASQLIEPSAGQAVVSGTAAVWGAWYGLLVPVAAGVNFSSEDYALSALLTADALLAGAVVAQSDLVGLDPRDTLLPQIGGVAGGTVGAMGAALFTGSDQAIATGAVAGSLAGFVGGALLRVGLGREERVSLAPPGPRRPLDLPGHWSFAATPALMEDGALGAQVSLSAWGW